MSTQEAKNNIPEEWLEKIKKEKDKKNCSDEEKRKLYQFVKEFYLTKSVASMANATDKSINVIRNIKLKVIKDSSIEN